MPTISAARIALLFALSATAGCVQPRTQPSTAPLASLPDDPHSFARPREARVTHVSLDLTPDFATSRLSGTARLTIARAPGADSIVLDVRDLTIRRVTDARGNALGFNVGAAQGFLGAPLAIALPASGDVIAIEYETAPGAAAVQWLSPEQTSGKKLPFMFTQGQAILTRTWIPTQDGPGIRQTYDAAIHVPDGMRAVMSAAHTGTAGERDRQGRAVNRFVMDKPIPPYLIALAVGDIAFRPIGTRTGVYAEPAVVERAAAEFVEVDRMMETAERLYGPYRWGRYDILVLPPSFPFGGMENPTLTFATPTIIAGDRSLVSLIAHELAHSWSGNLVTNATWDDFWLNEGFTTYIEKRLMEELRGKPYADMLRALGRREMNAAVEAAGGPQSADSRLRIDLKGRDPDEGFTDIAYEKGAAFLETVESVVGRDRLDVFLRDYFNRFAFQPMTSEMMLAHMAQRLFRTGEEMRINPAAWIYQPGIPSNIPTVRSDAFTAVDAQVQGWNRGAAASTLSTGNWSTQEWLHFLHALPDTIPAARLADLDQTFRFSSSGNSEILFAWLQKAIANRYTAAFPALENFLTSMGRRKFLAPLYTDLAKTEWGRAMAMDIYRRARPTYHPVSVGSIDTILKWNQN
ncbi:MAG TPA: M1 family metallopeptidase [Gemmatimonadaceae bacterium]|nr:M1 family metallopeptidase [Gemmatimonadaceae bacterium]